MFQFYNFILVTDDNCACADHFSDYAKLDDKICESSEPPSANVAFRSVYQAWSKSAITAISYCKIWHRSLQMN